MRPLPYALVADYDHIMPVIGYNATQLFYNDMYHNRVRELPLATAFKTRSQCVRNVAVQPWNYCIPTRIDYGMAITGPLSTAHIAVYAKG